MPAETRCISNFRELGDPFSGILRLLSGMYRVKVKSVEVQGLGSNEVSSRRLEAKGCRSHAWVLSGFGGESMTFEHAIARKLWKIGNRT